MKRLGRWECTVLGHAGWVVGAKAMKGAPQDTPGEEVRRGYARGRIRALVHSCGSGDITVEASHILNKERRSAENELFQKSPMEG